MAESQHSEVLGPREWNDFRTWGTEDFYTYLKEKLDWDSDGVQESKDVKIFKDLTLNIIEKENGTGKKEVSVCMDGMKTEMTAQNLQDKGIGEDTSHEIIHWIQKLWKIPNEPKVFSDPIHGHIEIPPLLIRIIDTPEFQRMRNMKQLGGTYMVFPGAAHNRFEHSLGVAYLAGELVRTLKEKQPELEISQRDILCVQIAGLCHDLGHGPFSHLFDTVFPKVLKEKEHQVDIWKHEVASVEMLRHLVKKNHLQGVLKLNGLEHLEKDLDFIESLILGEPKENEKDFLYEIVANGLNGIDVDKWDYFARDRYHLGIGTSFDHERLLKFIRVCEAEDQKRHICFKEKEAGNLYNMFYTRHFLHSRAYQHPVCNIIEYMIAEAFVAAEEGFKIMGSQNREYKLSTAMNDMEAYAKLTDSVLDTILHTPGDNLKEAKKIIQKITCRELYYYIGESPPCRPEAGITTDRLKTEMANKSKICEDDIVVDVVSLNYGQKTANPLEYVYFYNKNNPTARKLDKDEVSLLLPHTFGEEKFRVYSKRIATVKALQEAWEDVKKDFKWKSKQAADENTLGKAPKRHSKSGTSQETTGNDSKKYKRNLKDTF